MAIYKKGEFAKMCGIGASAVTNAINRGHLKDDNGRIDTSLPINYDYMMIARARNGLSDLIHDNPNSVLSKIKAAQSEPVEKKPASDSDGAYDLERKKKLADLEKKNVDIRIALLTEQRLKGESIPTQLVKELINQLSKSFLESYRDKSEQLVINISHKNKLSAERTAEMKGELIKAINRSHDDAITEAMTSLKSILQQIKP
jgi:hypothetical protein